jgi:DNA-binding IclR family transcriptional regulator
MKSQSKAPAKENGFQKGAQSVYRTISLLRSVAKHSETGSRLSDIAKEVGIHIATAHRILSVLVQEGFVTYDSTSKRYSLGIELYNLGKSAHQYALRDRYRHALEKIANETEDTVFLLIRSGNDVLCIDLVEGKYAIRTMTITLGARRPLGIGAGSLCLIAFLPDEQFDSILSENAARYPHYKGLTKKDIKKLGLESRSRGYVVSKGLFHEGVTSVGTPIFDKEGELVAAITVSAIDRRMSPQRQDEISALVKKISEQGRK